MQDDSTIAVAQPSTGTEIRRRMAHVFRRSPPPRNIRLRSMDLARLLPAWNSHTIALNGLFVLAILYTLFVAREVLAPVVLAIFLSLLLRPVVRGLKRLGLSDPIGAAVVMLTILGALALVVTQLSDPASDWLRKAPETAQRVEEQVRRVIMRPAAQVTKAAQQVERIAAVNTDPSVPKVELKSSGFLRPVLVGTKKALSATAITLALLYFLLASGDRFLRKWVSQSATMTKKKQSVAIARAIVSGVSTYLSTIALIHVALGTLTGLAMWAIGMPSPALWGVMGGLLNMIPYLGALVTVVVLGLVGFTQFNSVGHALIPPLIYWSLTILESGFVTPFLLGRRFALNPVLVFLSLLFWGWIWGIVGTLLAVPILVTTKIVCDHSAALAPVAAFLSE